MCRLQCVLGLLALVCSVYVVADTLPSGAMLGAVTTSGTGCSADSVGIAITPDGKTLSILFSTFTTQTDLQKSHPFGRSNCDISIPVVVPPGYSLTTYKLDYRGWTSVPVGTSTSFTASYFFGAAAIESKINMTWQATTEASDFPFLLTDSLQGAITVPSPCGQQTTMRINSAIVARAQSGAMEDAQIQMDSADISRGVVIGMQWIPCSVCSDAQKQAAGCSPHAFCGLKDGTTTCTCNDGYHGDGKTCTQDQVNECAVNNGGCTAPAVCLPTGSGHQCVCPDGYTPNAGGCSDINECATTNGGCAVTCTNLPGSFYCGPCPAGSVGNGVDCTPKLFKITHAGTGCPTNKTDSVTATFLQGGNTISLLFTDLILDSSTFPVDTTKRTVCDVSIPVQVPPGYSVSTYTVDYRGVAFVPTNSFGRLDAEYFFAGNTLPPNSTYFPGGMFDQYYTRYAITGAAQVPETECGQDVMLRLRTSLTGRHNSTDTDSDLLLTVESADVTQTSHMGANITLVWQRCAPCAVNNCGENSVCYQGKTAPVCSCMDGYALVGGTCQDINECATDNGGCMYNRQCVNFAGSRKCVCPVGSGFELDATGNCVDVDECKAGTAQCSTAPAVTCINTVGSYTCGPCPLHYEGDGKTCKQVDCGPYPTPAPNSGISSLVTVAGSVPLKTDITCSANYLIEGTQSSTATVVCQDDHTWQTARCVFSVDPCTVNNGGCAPHRPCTYDRVKNKAVCGDCEKGWAPMSTMAKFCLDVNECATSNGGCAAQCVNTEGSFTCKGCPAGYTPDGSGNCLPVSCGVPSAVTNASFSCSVSSQGAPIYTFNSECVLSCGTGYQLAGPSNISCLATARWSPAGACLDVNECATVNGGCDANALCFNSVGGFSCACKAGYKDGTDQPGKYCVDVNECETSNGGCSLNPFVQCTNVDGSFSCGPCPTGFSGDGKTCNDINECANNNGGCWDKDGCINSEGSYTCSPCPPGYTQSQSAQQQICDDIDECALGTAQCDSLTKCTNTAGSYQCSACPAGYVDGLPQQGKQCVAVNAITIVSTSAAGTGCPPSSPPIFKIVGAGPNTWKLAINFTAPFGLTTAAAASSAFNRACSIRVVMSFNYDGAGQPFSTGGMTYYANGAIAGSTTTVRLGYDSFWSGQQSTPTTTNFNGPISGRVIKKDLAMHTLSVPPPKQQVIFAINANVIVQKVAKGDSFLVDYMESDTFVALVNYIP